MPRAQKTRKQTKVGSVFLLLRSHDDACPLVLALPIMSVVVDRREPLLGTNATRDSSLLQGTRERSRTPPNREDARFDASNAKESPSSKAE